MKKTLLFATLFLVYQFSYGQLYISEIMVSPPGDDLPREFIELRGTPNATIANDTYLVQIEGDSDGTNNPGDVESESGGGIIDLSGQVLGSNGFLVILYDGGTPETKYPYSVNSNATILTGVTDGTLEDKSHTFLLITAPTKPSSSDDIDDNDDGQPNGTVYESWTILDGISLLDDDDFGANGEFGYADVIFCHCNDGDNVKIKSGANIVYTGANDFDYFARVGNSTGNTLTANASTSDWFGGDLSSVDDLTVENWKLSTSSGKSYPESFGGQEVDNIGSTNPTGNTASVDEVFSSQFSVFPNPAKNTLNISSKVSIDKAEVFNLIGKKVISNSKSSNNSIDISNLSKGIYILKLTSGDSVATRKIIKE